MIIWLTYYSVLALVMGMGKHADKPVLGTWEIIIKSITNGGVMIGQATKMKRLCPVRGRLAALVNRCLGPCHGREWGWTANGGRSPDMGQEEDSVHRPVPFW